MMQEKDRAILVGVGLQKIITEKDLDELSELVKTCGLLEVARMVQNIKSIDVAYYIGSGKVEELKSLCEHYNANCVVFDVELSGSKVRNLERELGVAVLDRSQVILDIFAQRATSAEGKLQVELAQLEYNLPRLAGSSGGNLDKLKNGVGMRGPGEKKLELDKRVIRDNIAKLKKEIAKISVQRGVGRKQSINSRMFRVAIVGYTNSGKSTLMNALTKANVLAENKLFATLDPITKKAYLSDDSGVGAEVLFTDTVGFISNLPHQFIKAFLSTLEETTYADLLLHVIDASNKEFDKQIDVVNGVLKSIGADKIPQIRVFNKCDLVNGKVVTEADDTICISAKNNTNTDKLKNLIYQKAIKKA
ncbi:MAG: GTPase HflX [Firmicutes bacterium]|nr:GTPase HflX [Bacillota bacterium]